MEASKLRRWASRLSVNKIIIIIETRKRQEKSRKERLPSALEKENRTKTQVLA